MSIYVMTVGELAKKRGQPVGEFVKLVNSLGVEAGSHAKRLTQEELNNLVAKLDGTTDTIVSTEAIKTEKVDLPVSNPNVLIVKNSKGKSVVALVDATLNDDGTISTRVVEANVQDSLGETLLEYRKQVGMKMGIN